jgi:pyruvate dehydrogenase E1 component beta subunit
VEVVDLLTVSPMDTKTITDSVSKTGRLVIVHEGPRNCGIGSEVAARIVETNALLQRTCPTRTGSFMRRGKCSDFESN